MQLLLRLLGRFHRGIARLRQVTADPRLRTKTALYFSLTFNTVYALFQLFLGFYYRSPWFYALAVYYLLLTVMRFFLLRDLKNLTPGEALFEEWHRYRFCGTTLVVIAPVILVITQLVLWQNRSFSYSALTMLAIGIYAFGALFVTLYSFICYRRRKSPLLRAAKAVSFTTATVSLFSLETALLTAHGWGADTPHGTLALGLSGALLCLAILTLGAVMLHRYKNHCKTSTAPRNKEVAR